MKYKFKTKEYDEDSFPFNKLNEMAGKELEFGDIIDIDPDLPDIPLMHRHHVMAQLEEVKKPKAKPKAKTKAKAKSKAKKKK